MQRELMLDFEVPLAEGLTRALAAMIGAAREEEQRAIESPGSAMHNYRRSLRRAEAVLDLAWPVLRGGSRKWLEKSLARARRRTRMARDIEAVMPLVGKLEELDIIAPGDATLLAVRAWLEASKAEVANDEMVAWRLRKNVRALAGVPEIFGAAIQSWVDIEQVLERFRGSYRAARRALKTAKKSRRIEDVHAFRRAVRKVRYQLELLASAEPPARATTTAPAEGGDAPAEVGPQGAPAPELPAWLVGARALHGAMKALARDLGYVSDLAALEALLNDAKRKKSSELDVRRLLVILGELTAGNVERVLNTASEVFASSPKHILAEPEPAEPEDDDKDAGDDEGAGEAAAASAEGAPEAAETAETAVAPVTQGAPAAPPAAANTGDAR